MTIPLEEGLIDLDVSTGKRHFSLSRLGYVLLGGIAAIWTGAAFFIDLHYPSTWLLPAGIATLGLAGMLVLDHQLTSARDAERRARRVNTLLSQVLERLPVGIQIKDSNLRYVWVNSEHSRRTRRARTELLGKTAEEIGLDPALAAAVIAHDRRVLESAEVDGPEEQLLRGPDGQLIQISLVTKIPLFQDGKVSHIATVGADLTTWREAQLRAEELRRLLETIMDAAPVTIQVIDHDLKTQWANRAYREQAGRQPDALLSGTLTDLPLETQQGDTTALDREMFATGRRLVQIEQHFSATADQPERHLLVTKVPILDAAGNVVQLLTIGTDVTTLKRAEAAADTANRLIEGILHNVPLSIQVKDSDLRFRWVNRQFGEALRTDPTALLGKTWADLDNDLPAEALARARQTDRLVLQTGETLRFSERWVMAGEFRHFLVVKAPILDAGGRASHVITIGADVTELHQLRAQADDARRQLQHVLDTVPVTLTLKDKDRRFQWVNREFERVHGAPAHTVIGRRTEDFLADRVLAEKAERSDVLLLSTGIELPENPQQHISADGDRREFTVRRVPVRDADGAIEGILVVGIDVTDLTRATAELRRMNEELEQRVAERANELAKANELVATVVRSAPVPIVTFRLDGTIIGWNPAAAKVTGFSETEALSGAIPQRSPEGRAQFAEMQRLIGQGESFANFEAQRKHKDGSDIELLISGAPLRRTDGTIDGAVGIWIDVTERKKAERELAAARTNLVDAIESLDHAIVLYDRDDRIVLFNQHHLDHNPGLHDVIKPGVHFEHRFRTAVDRGVIVVPDGRNKEEFIAERIAFHRQANGTRIQRRRSDGRTYQFWENRTRNGGIVAVGVDVTEQLKIEQQLRQAQRMEAVGQLTGGVAHDFNNLLAVVISNLDLLLRRLPPNDGGVALVDDAIDAAKRGAALTRRLLAFARQQTLRPAATDINMLMAGMRPLLQRAVGEAIAIEYVAADNLWLALVDPSQLENAILNLSVNARDAMPEGGKLTITTHNDVLDQEYAAQHADVTAGDYVCVRLSDTGTGIAPEILGHVFEPFFTTKEVGKGSGLGLSMVFGFLKQSGGHVRIYSELGLGTCITLYLPRAVSAIVKRAADQPVSLGHGETILLVEDNAQLRRSSVNLVKALGYRVVAAEDAKTALALLDQHPEVSLLFSDIVLPGGTNGFDLAREVRRRKPDLPVLFTSGFVDPSMLPDSSFERDTVVLTKPFGSAELAARLSACLRRDDGSAV